MKLRDILAAGAVLALPAAALAQAPEYHQAQEDAAKAAPAPAAGATQAAPAAGAAQAAPAGQAAASATANAVTPVTVADLSTGAAVSDTSGGAVGTIESAAADGAVISTGKTKAKIPLTGLGKTDKGIVIGMTKAQLEAAAGAATASAGS